MIDFIPKGAIFDVDDTLLANQTSADMGYGMHERARLRATHEAARRHNIPELLTLTPKQNYEAFLNAATHTADAAIWQVMREYGLVDSDDINPDNKVFSDILVLKNDYFQTILRDEGEEVPGASKFLRAFANTYSLNNKFAIGSMGIKPDLKIFVEKYELQDLFPDDHIVSRERVTHPKPHPEVFNVAFDILDIPEEDRKHVCVFEDDPRGIMAAKAAGMYVCAITRRYDREALAALEVAPDVIADTFDEFATFFKVR